MRRRWSHSAQRREIDAARWIFPIGGEIARVRFAYREREEAGGMRALDMERIRWYGVICGLTIDRAPVLREKRRESSILSALGG